MGFSSSALLTIAGINLFLGYVMGLFFGGAFRDLSFRLSIPRLSLPRLSLPRISLPRISLPRISLRRRSKDAVTSQPPEVEPVTPTPKPEPQLPQPVEQHLPVEDVQSETHDAVPPPQEPPPQEPPPERPAAPQPDAIAKSVVAVMSSVDSALVEMDFQLRAATTEVPDEFDRLSRSLQARAKEQLQVLRNCSIHLHGAIDPGPQQQLAIDSLAHAEQQVEAIVQDLSQTDSDESRCSYSERLLNETFQVQVKLEQLMVAWLAAKNSELVEAVKASTPGVNGILTTDDQLSQWWTSNADESLMAIQVDYDLLGRINNEHGSLITNSALDELQKLIRGLIPAEELVGECELAGRHLLFFVAADKSSGEELAERIRQSIDNSKLSFRGVPLRLTASVALSSVTAAAPLDETLQRLSVARDCAKSFGRNSTYFWKETEPAIVLPAGVDVPNWQIELENTSGQNATVDNEKAASPR